MVKVNKISLQPEEPVIAAASHQLCHFGSTVVVSTPLVLLTTVRIQDFPRAAGFGE